MADISAVFVFEHKNRLKKFVKAIAICTKMSYNVIKIRTSVFVFDQFALELILKNESYII